MIPECLVLVVTWSLVKVTHSNPASHHLTWPALVERTIDPDSPPIFNLMNQSQ